MISEIAVEVQALIATEIVVSLSRQLESEHGNSFSEKNLRRMVQFYEYFPEEQRGCIILKN